MRIVIYNYYGKGLSDTQQQERMNRPREVKCDVCGRCFRRKCDETRHKYFSEHGAVRCMHC